jgi:hypothetical protein
MTVYCQTIRNCKRQAYTLNSHSRPSINFEVMMVSCFFRPTTVQHATFTNFSCTQKLHRLFSFVRRPNNADLCINNIRLTSSINIRWPGAREYFCFVGVVDVTRGWSLVRPSVAILYDCFKVRCSLVDTPGRHGLV